MTKSTRKSPSGGFSAKSASATLGGAAEKVAPTPASVSLERVEGRLLVEEEVGRRALRGNVRRSSEVRAFARGEELVAVEAVRERLFKRDRVRILPKQRAETYSERLAVNDIVKVCIEELRPTIADAVREVMLEFFSSEHNAQKQLSHLTAVELDPEKVAERANIEGNMALRKLFCEQCGQLLSATQIADLIGSNSKNRYQPAKHLEDSGKVFSVKIGKQKYYPSFQFTAKAPIVPRPEVTEVIDALSEDYAGWSLALWWISSNEWLDDSTPMETLNNDPQRVVAAAKSEQAEFARVED